MAALSRTIGGRIMLGVLAVHIFLLPALYLGLVYVLEQNNQEMFLNSSRSYARFLADDLERLEDISSPSEVVEILDSIVLSGVAVYAKLEFDKGEYWSSLVDPANAPDYSEDFAIGEHGDDVYLISIPVINADQMLILQIGFDETPYIESSAAANKNGLLVLAAYLLVLLLLLPVVSRRIAAPIRSLQSASRQVSSGELAGQLSAETDLVEFVELADDLERMKNRLIGVNEQLQQEIRDREDAETERRNLERQLRHSQRLETVGTMAGGIAHELNNILLPIILHAEMAIEDLPQDSDTAADITSVLQAAKRAKSLVGQVLTFSHKIDSNEFKRVDVAAVVTQATAFFRASLPPTATLKVELSADCPPVLGDAGLLNQLILNLCTNALQSLVGKEGTMLVRLDVVSANENLAARYPDLPDCTLVRLTVTDTGHGMDAGTRNRIFEPFFTTRAVGEGTGLGLSVVHGIVNDLNGAIEVESTLESGTTFYVYFPADEKHSLQAENET